MPLITEREVAEQKLKALGVEHIADDLYRINRNDIVSFTVFTEGIKPDALRAIADHIEATTK